MNLLPFLLFSFASDTNDWIRAKPLKPGDIIAIATPAGVAEEAPVRAFTALMEKQGYKVRIPEGMLGRRDRHLGGTDSQRADEMNALIRDPAVRAIFPARGGYGLTRIIDRIDYKALKADPKIITGYSDLTALHLAVARKARVVTFHSPLPMHSLYKGETEPHAFAYRSFKSMILAPLESHGAQVVSVPEEGPRPSKLVGGKARGRLLGGNLSLVAATIGTPYAIEPEGAILLLEDVNEAPYRVDRMLSQLRLAGVLDKVSGVVLGSFTTKEPDEPAKIDAILREYFGSLKVPVITGFPSGHAPANATLPHGGLVEIDANAGTLTLLESPLAR